MMDYICAKLSAMKITRLILLTAFTLFLNGPVLTQGVWNFGLQGGLNMSWISQPTVAGEELSGDFGSRLSSGKYGALNVIKSNLP